MRRLIILAIAFALALAMASPAAAGPKGDLTSAFRNEVNQFAVDDPADLDLDRPTGHVTPLSSPGPIAVCDTEMIGTWYSIFDADRSVLAPFTAEFFLDGEELDKTRTPIRKRTFAGDLVYIVTEGVPVIGTLDVGMHTLEYRFDEDGDGVIDFTFSTVLDVSPTNC